MLQRHWSTLLRLLHILLWLVNLSPPSPMWLVNRTHLLHRDCSTVHHLLHAPPQLVNLCADLTCCTLWLGNLIHTASWLVDLLAWRFSWTTCVSDFANAIRARLTSSPLYQIWLGLTPVVWTTPLTSLCAIACLPPFLWHWLTAIPLASATMRSPRSDREEIFPEFHQLRPQPPPPRAPRPSWSPRTPPPRRPQRQSAQHAGWVHTQAELQGRASLAASQPSSARWGARPLSVFTAHQRRQRGVSIQTLSGLKLQIQPLNHFFFFSETIDPPCFVFFPPLSLPFVFLRRFRPLFITCLKFFSKH